MSLASAQSSWLNSAGGSAPTPPTSLALPSGGLTVGGVQITGLTSTGKPTAQLSGTQRVASLYSGEFTTRNNLVVNVNSATQFVEWSDEAFCEPDGDFDYTYPLPLTRPPYLVVSSVAGTSQPIINSADADACAGVCRQPISGFGGSVGNNANSRRFVIQGVGQIVPSTDGRFFSEPPTPTPPAQAGALTPTQPQLLATPSSASVFRLTFTPSFTTPLGLIPSLVSSLKMSWGSTVPWDNGTSLADYSITAYLTTSASSTQGTGVLLGSWTGIPARTADNSGDFENEAYNQSQTFSVIGLQPNAQYWIAFDFNVVSQLTQNIRYALNFELFNYYKELV